MNTKTSLLFIMASLLFAACSSSAVQPTETMPIPIVKADDTIMAEGRVGPIHFAEIAFGTSGMVSEVMIKEGELVKAGQSLIRLGGESDAQYTAAQLELVDAQPALDELLRSRDTNLAHAEIDLLDAQEAYKKAENYLKYLNQDEFIPQTIYTSKLISTGNGWQYDYEARNTKAPAPQEWIVDAENDLALKKAKLGDAPRIHDNLKDGPDTEHLLSIPLTGVMATMVGLILFNKPLTIVYGLSGIMGWLIGILIIAAISSAMPARNASHLTIKDTLAYEG